MLGEDEKKMYQQILDQVQVGMKVSLTGLNDLLEDDDFKKGFGSFMYTAAGYVMTMVNAYEAAGFTREEAVTLAAATVGKDGNKK